jgi:hypothetical protein
MRKGKLSRVTAAALTLAMAFTLLAVPASAAVKDTDAVYATAMIAEDKDTLLKVPEQEEEAADTADAEDETPVPASAEDDSIHAEKYITDFFEAIADANVNVKYVVAQGAYKATNDDGKDEALKDGAWAALVVEKGADEDDPISIYTGALPSETVAGLQNKETGKIVWLSKKNIQAITEALADAKDATLDIDWDLGLVTIEDSKLLTRNYSGNEQVSEKTNLIVGGVAVAGIAAVAYLVSLLSQLSTKTASAA